MTRHELKGTPPQPRNGIRSQPYGIGGNIDGEMKRDPHWSGDSFVPEEIRNLAVHRGFHLETFNRDSGLKRLDIGLSAGVDYKYKSFFVGGAVEYGLLPVSKEFLKSMFEDVFGENKITRSPIISGWNFM